MNKRSLQSLAGKLATLMPASDTVQFALWRDMVEAFVYHAVPIKWAKAFESACERHGLWNRDLEERV